MRPVRVTLTSATNSAPIPLDWRLRPTDVTLQTIVSSGGSSTHSVQYTTDDVQSPTYNPSTGNWFDVPGMGSLTSSTRVKLDFPVTAVRLSVSAFSSGSVRLDVISNGP